MGTDRLGTRRYVAARSIAYAWLASSCLSRRCFQASVRAASRVTPNPSFNLTRYGRHCKAGPRHLVHHRVPALQFLPPRAG